MVSGDGKKRKASVAAAAGVEAPAKREPRRGMGVAELERIRVELEMAETCYAIVPSPLSSAAAALHHLPPPAAAPCFVGRLPGMAMAHHQYVGNGAVQVEYFTPYYRAQHYANDSLTSCRLFRSNGQHASSHQKNHVDQIHSAVTTAHPTLGHAAASSESSSSACQLQDHRRTQPPQLGQRKKVVAFVDLVDSDDDDGGAVEELDLELKL